LEIERWEMNIVKIRKTLPYFIEVYEIGKPHYVKTEGSDERYIYGDGTVVVDIKQTSDNAILVVFENEDWVMVDWNYLTYVLREDESDEQSR